VIVREIHAANYRSLRSIRFPTERLTVFVGANGVGKTNLYRSLQLLQASAAGTLSHELATEGGMESAAWTGKRRVGEPMRITLQAGFGEPAGKVDIAYSYRIAIGFAGTGAPDAFPLEPQIREEVLLNPPGVFPLESQVKEEGVLFHHRSRATKLLERRGPSLLARDTDDRRIELRRDLLPSETALGAFDEPQRFPEIHDLKRTMLDWRFYHSLRTDADAPLRRPSLAVASPTMASDGSNLAAVFATLLYIRGDTADLDTAISDAFPGASLEMPLPGRVATFGMVFPDHPKRVFQAPELSDGTLRYLALAGALLALRLPAFIALNEPESSLHPDLLEPLARLIVKASERTQIWLVTHSERLAAALAKHGGIEPRAVIKKDGETWIEGLKSFGRFEDDD